MGKERTGETAVIFVSQRTADDGEGYGAAAQEMEALAATQPGYRGIVSARDAQGFGITVSYWADDDAARAWRDVAEHSATRERGRAHWYEHYDITVATVTRGYRWAAKA